MMYPRAYAFVFDNPKWGLNVLCGCACQFIPVVGPIVFLGYNFEVIEALHRRGQSNYPDFDFNRFTKYLVRGVWPFLVQVIVTVPLMFFFGVLWIVAMIGMDKSAAAKEPWIAFGVIGILFFLYLAVMLLMGLVLVPLTLWVGLSQEFALGRPLQFLRDLWKRAWQELLLIQLFLWVTSPFVFLAGLLLCCIGLYPASVLFIYAQHHLHYQLYQLYLERGGEEIPLKVEPA